MGAVLVFTFATYTRAAHFGQAIDVVSLDMEFFFEFLPHALCPRLCAKETAFEFHIVDAHLVACVDGLCEPHTVRRCAAQYGSAEVLHEHNLLFGFAG